MTWPGAEAALAFVREDQGEPTGTRRQLAGGVGKPPGREWAVECVRLKP